MPFANLQQLVEGATINVVAGFVRVKEEKCFTIKKGHEFESILFKLLSDDSFRESAGKAAAQFIENEAGASDICFEKIKEAIA